MIPEMDKSTENETRPTLHFRPIHQSSLRHWSRPSRFTFFDELAVAPIGDTELLHLSHYAPIAIRLGPSGPGVVVVLHSAFNTAKVLSAESKWLPPYAPMALRCLPFRVTGFDSEPEFAESLCMESDEHHAFVDPDGEPSKEFAYVIELLQRLAKGGVRLSNAAKLLLAADCLTPLYPLDSQPDTQLLVVSEERLRSLSGPRAGSLTADSNLPFELAAASIFSQRWLARGSIQEQPAVQDAPRIEPQAKYMEYGANDSLDEPLLMDDSGLFSIDDFLGAVSTDNDRT